MRYVMLLGVFVFLTLFTACASVASAILGEREVNNLFGLNDREIIFRLPDTSSFRNTRSSRNTREIFPAQDISVPVVSINLFQI